MHERLNEELQATLGVSTRQSSNAKQRWKTEENQPDMLCHGNAMAMPTGARSQSQPQTEKKDDADEAHDASDLFLQLQRLINAPVPMNMARVAIWKQNGASDRMILETVTRLMAKRKADPPSSMNYFEKAVEQAVSESLRPMEKSNETPRPYTAKKSQLDVLVEGTARARAARERERSGKA